MLLSKKGGSLWDWAGIERIFFVLGLLLLAFPFLGHEYYFTVDGPSHVYNAWLLLELFQPSAGVHPLWELNPLPVPDWTGHALLAVLLTILEPQKALTVVHLLCVLGFVLAFRMVVAQCMKGPLWPSFLAFPFALSAPFAMGYFNFALALPMMMLVVRQWHGIRQRTRTRIAWFGLSALLVLCYFSHLMPFVFVVFWLGAQVLGEWIRSFRQGSLRNEQLHGRTLHLVLALMPSLLLMAWYMSGNPDGSTWVDPPKDRLEQIWKPFVLADMAMERSLWAAAVVLVLMAFLSGFQGAGPDRDHGCNRSWSGPALAFAAVMFALIFVLPDGFGKGSDILFRLSVLAHVAFLVSIPFVGMGPRRGVALALAALSITSLQQRTRAPLEEWRSSMLRTATERCSKGPAGRTVSFIWLDWSQAHLPELGFACSKAVDLSNYELDLAHFPLRWREEHRERIRRLPPDPLDALGELGAVPGALIRASDEVVVVGEMQDDRQRELIHGLEQELRFTHVEEPGDPICRIFIRNRHSEGTGQVARERSSR